MKIGLTYDLRDDYLAEGYSERETAEFDQPATIAAIEKALGDLGHQTDRIGNIKALAGRLVAGARWDLIFNIAEGLRGYGREAQVPSLLEAWDIPYTFSDPLVLCLTLHKGMTKRVIRDLGIPTPDFAEVAGLKDIERVNLPYPLFAKPIAEGTGKGVDAASKIRDSGELRQVCRNLLETFDQPVLVETFLPGREFTVGIVGTDDSARSVGVAEVILRPGAEKEVYSFRNKEYCEEVVEYRPAGDAMARQAEAVALAAWRGLNCRDAGRVDLRADASGRPQFIEANPLAGLHPSHSDLPIICTQSGIMYNDLIMMIVDSAARRIPRRI